jgi:hypothetical protein
VEPDVQDKPMNVQKAVTRYNPAQRDEDHRNQLRSLQAVDRAVGAIVAKIAALGQLEQTVFIFTSDNGYLWGEHSLVGKIKPYEESIRVPLVVVVPGTPPRTEAQLVAANLDIGPTLFDLVGITHATDGTSLLPLLQDPQSPWRSELLIQIFHHGGSWAGLRTKDDTAEWKYVEYAATGERELYDLVHDPYEEYNQAALPELRLLLEQFAQRLDERKGLAMISASLPPARVGAPYSGQLTAWGGRLPYTWSVVAGRLPSGLTLESSSGLIWGIPTQVERPRVTIQVEAASLATHTGKPEAYRRAFQLPVQPANAPPVLAAIGD